MSLEKPRGLLARLKDNRFFRSLLTLSAGTLIAQAVTILASPLLTRLFSEYELALFAFALVPVNTFMASVNGGYNNGIVVEEDGDKVRALVKLSFLVGIGVSVLVGIGSYVYLRWFSREGYPALLIASFVLLTLISFSLIQTLTAFNNRRKDYKTIAAVGVWRSLFQSLGNVAAGFLGFGAPGLLFSYLLGNVAGIRRQARDIRPELSAIRATPGGELMKTARENYRYPLFTAPAYLVNSFS